MMSRSCAWIGTDGLHGLSGPLRSKWQAERGLKTQSRLVSLLSNSKSKKQPKTSSIRKMSLSSQSTTSPTILAFLSIKRISPMNALVYNLLPMVNLRIKPGFSTIEVVNNRVRRKSPIKGEI